MRRMVTAFAGIALTVVSIPALALLLRFSNVFSLFVS
jgi:hypothetical protein